VTSTPDNYEPTATPIRGSTTDSRHNGADVVPTFRGPQQDRSGAMHDLDLATYRAANLDPQPVFAQQLVFDP
jgi:hypothetical protein